MVIKNIKHWLLAVIILSLAGILYFYKLEQIPNGFYVDEASVAYNAYSISTTGKDEFGFSYPILFRLMGSYTPSLFIYLSSFLINIFGTGVLVFRSISSFAAYLSIFIFYILVRKMKLYKLNLSYAAITLFYSISPWMVFNARLGYETTLAFLFFNLGAYFLYLSCNKPQKLTLAVIFLSLSTQISHNQRLLVPIFLLGFFFMFKTNVFKKENVKSILRAFVVGLILHIPYLFVIGTKAFWIKSVNFDFNNLWNIINYLSPKTLFYENPDIDLQHTIPKMSMMYNWMVVPYFIGLYLLIKRIKDYRYKFIALYFTVSLLPAVVSSSFVSSQRSLPFIIPLSIIIGIGVDEVLKLFKPFLRAFLLIVLAGYSLVMLYGSYFVLFPRERALAWNKGYDGVAEYIITRPEQQFLIDDTRNPRAYILLLYHLKYSPVDYQRQVDPFYRNNYYSAPPPADYYHFANIEVRKINWKEDPKKELTIIGDPLSVSEQQSKEHNLTKVFEFKDPLMNTIMVVHETNPKLPGRK